MGYIEIAGLKVDALLHEFINKEAILDTRVNADRFWNGFAAILRDLAPQNHALLARRDELQARIDDWHRAHSGKPKDQAAYEAFLAKIGYLEHDPAPFQVATAKVDDEIARIAGPQLVVPVTNARYALNAANARWGSLYDAFYGTDALAEDGGATRGGGFNEKRAARVIERVRTFLDAAVPLATGSHKDATAYRVAHGRLEVALANGTTPQEILYEGGLYYWSVRPCVFP